MWCESRGWHWFDDCHCLGREALDRVIPVVKMGFDGIGKTEDRSIGSEHVLGGSSDGSNEVKQVNIFCYNTYHVSKCV